MMLVPPDIGLHFTLLLLGLSAFTSLVTASLGAGGGVMMLIALSLVLPAPAIIPLHGCVQLGSNIGRSLMARRHTDWSLVRRFIPGVTIGAILAGLVLIQLPQAVWQLAIALFVLYLCWGPGLPRVATGPLGVWIMAALSGFLTMFVGATGPLVAAWLRQVLDDRLTIVATMATILTFKHTVKAIIFAASGFDFLPWFAFMVAMIACGAVGTWFGLKVLGRMNNRTFQRVFNLVLSLLALRLLWLGVTGLM